MNNHPSTLRVAKVFELLGSKGPCTIEEIIIHTKMSYATAYRIVHTLLDIRYLEVDFQKKFRISLGFLNSISSGLTTNVNLTQIAHSSLRKFHYQTNETVHLGILLGTKVFYLDKIDSSHLLRMHSYIGYQANLHCTGIGKALLAWLNKNVLDVIIPNLAMTKYTKRTITDKAVFYKHLKEIKTCGYAIDDEEHETHLYCLAAPIFDSRNHAIAAVSVSQPIIRFNKADKEPFLEYLWKCASEISQFLECKDYDACIKGNCL